MSYIAKYYRPGEEVLNTSSELETTLLKGEQVDRIEFDEANIKADKEGFKRAQGGPVLLGEVVPNQRENDYGRVR